ncbi:hypothetical protein IW147_004117 [Coemansia sp. RSA 720]|nr:hypothetical protein IW147_004117 [Coemansia sp. RSA 720]KAJ2539663.1 hypothetical protein GGF49_005064 [Coemansia sp. RSA 1853]
MATPLTKAQLRRHMRHTLSLLPPTQLLAESTTVFHLITSLPSYQQSQHLSIYINTPASELQTTQLIRHALQEGKRVYVPRCDGKVMQMVELKNGGLETMARNKWGILEPGQEEQAVEPSVLEFVVVPGVAFDAQGNRCGHGKGYYDRYLQQTQAFTCAVCLSDQVIEAVPVDAHDQKPNMIISPAGILFEKQ